MKKKTYKIGRTYQNNQTTPVIRLSGKWLESNNFHIGDNIVLYENQNFLIISKMTEQEKLKIEQEKKKKRIQKLEYEIKTLSN